MATQNYVCHLAHKNKNQLHCPSPLDTIQMKTPNVEGSLTRSPLYVTLPPPLVRFQHGDQSIIDWLDDCKIETFETDEVAERHCN